MCRRWLLALLIALVAVGHASSAFAEPPTDATNSTGELSDLQQRLTELEAQLSASDCDAACEALASMIRSADRICELDSGEPCTRARERVHKARQRVREACPDCSAAREESVPNNGQPPQPGGGVSEEVDAAPTDVSVAGVEDDGGCATCTVGQSRDAPRGLALLLLAACGLAARRTLRDRTRR